MEKYGFVYIWFDRKHKRYYIGCHWGHEDDGYVCSSIGCVMLIRAAKRISNVKLLLVFILLKKTFLLKNIVG